MIDGISKIKDDLQPMEVDFDMADDDLVMGGKLDDLSYNVTKMHFWDIMFLGCILETLVFFIFIVGP